MRTMMHTPRSVHPPLGTSKRPPELVCKTEPAAAACNCMDSQQLCHSCSRSLPANENDYAHSKECASTARDLQEVPRICQTSQVPHPALIHKSQWGQGTTQSSHLFLLLPTSNNNDACPLGHASTTGDTQVVSRTSQALHKLRLPQNLVCHCIHTHVWHEETTHPFRSLSMSVNDNAHSLEGATTTEDTQEVPRAFQVLHKPHLSFHCLSCVFHTNCRAPSKLGGTAV